MSLDPRRNAFRPDLADERLRGKLEAARFVVGEKRLIVSSTASLHRLPEPGSGVDTQALFGEDVLLFDERDGWAWAQLLGDGYVGYIPSADLGTIDGEATHRVRSLRTFVYPEADLKLPTARYLGIGSRVRVTRTEGDYAELSDGGFIFSRHLAGADSFEPDFVSVATRFLGTPYLWGGKSSLGIDCSGLVQLSLAEAGITSPRDSDMQATELGHEIEINADLSGLRRGDLIFWQGHVAVMLDETRTIHANGWSMSVLSEPLATAEKRIRDATGSGIIRIRRL